MSLLWLSAAQTYIISVCIVIYIYIYRRWEIVHEHIYPRYLVDGFGRRSSNAYTCIIHHLVIWETEQWGYLPILTGLTFLRSYIELGLIEIIKSGRIVVFDRASTFELTEPEHKASVFGQPGSTTTGRCARAHSRGPSYRPIYAAYNMWPD